MPINICYYNNELVKYYNFFISRLVMTGGVANPLQPKSAFHEEAPIQVGGGKLGPQQPENLTEIPDNMDPIAYIEKFVSSKAKKESFDKCSDFKIKGTFTKVGEHGPIKAFAYRNPPSRLDVPDCYYFERKWTVEFTDKDNKPCKVTFTKFVYTNVVIPRDTRDINYMQDKEYLATLAASTYSNFVEIALRGKCGGPGAAQAEYIKIKDHINKVQTDNSINITLFQGGKEVKQKDLRKSFGRASHVITQARINLRAGSSKNQNEVKAQDGLVLDLSQKVQTKAGEIFTKGQMHRQKRLVLVADDNSSPEIKELAKIQKFLYLEKALENPDFKNQDLIEELKKLTINEEQLSSFIESKNQRLNADFEDRWNFFVNAGRVDVLRNLYGLGHTQVSNELKTLLKVEDKKAGKFKGFMRKIARRAPAKQGVTDPLRTLLENQDDSIKKEREELIACYYRAFKEMQDLSKEQSQNEEKLLKIAVTDSEVQRHKDAAAKRQEVLDHYKDLFAEFQITDSILENIKPKTPPPQPDPEEQPETEPIPPEQPKAPPFLDVEPGNIGQGKMDMTDDEILGMDGKPKIEKEKEKGLND